MGYSEGQFICKLRIKDGGDVVLRAVRIEDAQALMDLVNPMAKDDYVWERVSLHNIEEARKKYSKYIKSNKKGKKTCFVGEINGEIIMVANYFIKKIANGVYKGKEKMEVSILIRKDYRKTGLGGKTIDFFIDTARKKNLAYVEGHFFHENFDSLILCKSRKLDVYRIDKNTPPHDKGWKKDLFKWGRPFDKVSAKIILQ